MISLEANTYALPSCLGVVDEALDFPQRLATLRKDHGFTQRALAERVGIHVVQLRPYEGGTSRPTLDVIRELAIALHVSANLLLFGRNERGPDDDLRIHFDPEYEARRSSVNGGATNGEKK
jgi:transcriptional regulator with XRE-family HTH domain